VTGKRTAAPTITKQASAEGGKKKEHTGGQCKNEGHGGKKVGPWKKPEWNERKRNSEVTLGSAKIKRRSHEGQLVGKKKEAPLGGNEPKPQYQGKKKNLKEGKKTNHITVAPGDRESKESK